MDLAPASPPAPQVLLVDDQETCLDLLRMVLELAGYRCVTARSGSEALLWCAAGAPHAVVTDLGMPDGDGRELGHWFKARYPSVPLVLVTGEDLESGPVERLRAIFDAILPKPIEPEKLLEVLQASIGASL